jgi:hypothetical protein
MRARARIESKAVAVKKSCQAVLDPENFSGFSSRRAAVIVLDQLVHGLRLGDQRFFEAVRVLDVFYCCDRDALRMETIPALCAALISLGHKLDNGERDLPEQDLPKRASELLDDLLVATGEPHLGVLASSEDVGTMERAVLVATQWRLSLPTVRGWSLLVATRLDALTCAAFRSMMAPLWMYNHSWVKLLTHHCPSDADCPPRRVAQGLLCVISVASSLIPVDALELTGLECLSSPMLSSCPKLQELPPDVMAVFLAALFAATCSDCKELQQDAHLVNDLLLRASTNIDADQLECWFMAQRNLVQFG